MPYTCNPCYTGGIDRRIIAQGKPERGGGETKHKHLFEKDLKHKRLEVWFKW
jgi:hypothetical protein